MLEALILIFALCLSLLAIVLAVAACAANAQLAKEMKTVRHQICENLTTSIPAIVRKEVHARFN